MRQITNKEYEEYQRLKRDIAYGRIITPECMRFICESNGYDVEKIGRHILEEMAHMGAKTCKEFWGADHEI